MEEYAFPSMSKSGSDSAAPSYHSVEAEYPIPKINLCAPPYSEENAK